MTYDVAIIGAGPAGSSAGYELAKNGLKVILFDKKKFPRFKACGGGLSLKAYRLFDFNIDNVLEKKIKTARIFFNSSKYLELKQKDYVGFTVKREKFDLFLAEKAIEKGVEFRDNCQVTSIENQSDGIVISTEKERISSRFVIGADGALSTTARFFGMEYPDKKVSIITEIEINDSECELYNDFLCFDFGIIPGGYGWIFPCKDRLSIGVYTVKHPKNIQMYLEVFIKKQGFSDRKRMFTRRGAIIPLGGRRQNLIKDRIILAGDAAGLVDPFLGEGIYYAVKSGKLAAKCIFDFLNRDISLNKYNETIYKEIVIPFQKARKISWFVFNFTRLSYNMLKRKGNFQDFVTSIITGDRGY
ncbi:geranylgeranyl reductase family protein [Candidatus Desantisbacteria bacterium]|nr:geranylgeranyl reductase family protein [Candidatus Desantisbacteria bacterium]